MIKFSQNYPTQTFRNLQSFTRINSNSDLRQALRAGLGVGFLGLSLFAVGCSGPTIRPKEKTEPGLLLRKWTVQTHGPLNMGDHGTEYSNPVLVENTLIFGNRSTGLTALYPSINQVRWELPIPGGVVSEIAVQKGNLYFGGADGYIYSVSVDNGKVNWRYSVRNPFVSRPTLAGGRVFVTASDDKVYALDAGTGKYLWHFDRRSSPTSATIYGASSPLVDGNEVIVGLSDGFLIGLSLEEGLLKWDKRLHTGSKFTNVNAHPVLESGVIYIPSYDGALYAIQRQTRNILWRVDAGGSKDAVIQDDLIYLPSSDGSIYSVQKNNGKVIWKKPLLGGTPTQLAVTDKYILVGSTHQYLYALDKKSGDRLDYFNAGYGSGFSGSPLFDSGSQRLYILSGAGNLYAFGLRQPRKKVYSHGVTDPYGFGSLSQLEPILKQASTENHSETELIKDLKRSSSPLTLETWGSGTSS